MTSFLPFHDPGRIHHFKRLPCITGSLLSFAAFCNHFFHFSYKFFSWHKHTMAATFAFNPNIHAHSYDFPTVFTTRMRFFHFDNIVKIKFFIYHLNYHHPFSSISLCSTYCSGNVQNEMPPKRDGI